MVKEIHRPFWTSLFTIPDPGNPVTAGKITINLVEIRLDEHAIDKLAENLEKKATIQN